jgi:hypothetical protein
MWILPSVKSRMRGSDRIGRRPEPAATTPAAKRCPGRFVVADDAAVLAELSPGHRRTRAAGSGVNHRTQTTSLKENHICVR